MENNNNFNGVKIFSATKAREREGLGERVTEWIQGQATQGVQITGTSIRQSSDHEFHCLTLVLFYNSPT